MARNCSRAGAVLLSVSRVAHRLLLRAPPIRAAAQTICDISRLLILYRRERNNRAIRTTVCSYWRCIAFDHPRFWGAISIESLSVGELGWAATRVATGNVRPVSLKIAVNDDASAVVDRLFPIIGDTLHRTRNLEVTVHNRYLPQLCDVLRRPAPILGRLVLDMSYPLDSPPDHPLPVDVFSGSCPLLREVHLESVPLPSSSIPAFTDAVSVLVSAPDGAWHDFPPQIFCLFPSIRKLSMLGGGMRAPDLSALPSDARAALATGFARLGALEIGYYETENMKVLRLFPTTAAIPQILVSHSDRDTVRAAVAQIPGDQLIMVLLVIPESDGEDLRVIYVSRDAQVVRAFVESREDFNPGQLNAASAMLCDAAFLARVAALRVSASFWSIAAPLFDSTANSVEELMLLMDDDDSAMSTRLPPAGLLLPRLRLLAIQAMGKYVCLTVDDILEFSGSVSAHAVALELHLVILSGDYTVLERSFISVQKTNGRRQSWA